MSGETFHNIYGHWVDLSVIIGAKIYTVETTESAESFDANKQKDELAASFAAKVGYYNVKGGVSISGNKKNETIKQNQCMSKRYTMKCQSIGGDNIMVNQNDWTLWKKSINLNNWSVINVTQIRNVIDLTEFSGESQIANYLEKLFVITDDVDDIDMNTIQLKHINNNAKKLRSDEILKTLMNRNNDSDIIEIKMEDYISQNNGIVYHSDARNFHNLSYKEKRKLIISSKLLHGRTMDLNGKVIPSSYPVFNLKEDKINEYCGHFQEINQMDQHIEIRYDEVTKCLVKSGYSCNDKNIEASLKLGIFAKAGSKYESKSNKGNSSYSQNKSKDCTFIAQYIYPKGRISLNEQCLKLTDECMNDFQLLQTNKMRKERFHQKYGYWFDKNVVIGGKIYSERSRSVRTNSEEKKMRDEFADAFQMKLNTCISVNGGGGFSSGKGNDIAMKNDYKSKTSSVNLLVIGGNAMSINEKNYTNWEESLNLCPNKWEIIDICETQNVLSLQYYIQKDYPNKYKTLFETLNVSNDDNSVNINKNDDLLLYKLYPHIYIQHDVWCICGQKMMLSKSKDCYNYSKSIYCDVCGKQFKDNNRVYHCPNGRGKSVVHPNGYDICKLCAV